MTLVYNSRESKSRAVDLFQTVLHTFLGGYVSPENMLLIDGHLEWMRRQNDEMRVNCVLRTDDATKTTKILLEVAFVPIRPIEQQKH